MKSFMHLFTDYFSLEEWINANHFCDAEELFVQVFCGIPHKQSVADMCNFLTGLLPNAKLLASTTDGEIIGGHITTNRIGISFTVMEKTRITTAAVRLKTDGRSMGEQLASQVPPTAKLAIVFAAGCSFNGEEFLQGFQEKLPPGCIVTGGMAGDNGALKQTWVSNGNEILDKGVVAAFFDNPDLAITKNYHLGWKPIGIPMQVTKADHNRVYEIDGIPTRKVYVKYFGEELASKLPKSGVAFPFILGREGMEIARACLKVHEDDSMSFGGNIYEGEYVRFGIGDISTILYNNFLITEELHKEFSPEAVFVYSCMANRRLFPDQSDLEIAALSKQAPTSGFFVYGEFFTSERGVELFNETMAFVALSEHPEKGTRPLLSETGLGIDNESNDIVKAMTHMVNAMAMEWEEKLNLEIEKNLEHERRVHQQNKLAQMGEMVAMIAHQWRQPLNALSATAINMTLRAQMEELFPEDIEKNALFIQKQCQKMSQTIETFMEFVKPAKAPQWFHLRQSIDSVLCIMERQLENHNIACRIDDTAPQSDVFGYEDQLEQVLLNLLSNARDAFDGCRTPSKQLTLTIKTAPEGGLVLAVEDNAGGIPQAIREKIFNPFFTNKGEGKGTGLGLYMSMEIMRKSFHGDLRYLPIEGGSRFELVFGNPAS